MRGAEVGRRRWKIGTYRQMCSHMCSHGAGAKSTLQRNGSNTQFSASTSKSHMPNHISLTIKADQLRAFCICLNTPTVAERECKIPPVSTRQPLCACVNAPFIRMPRCLRNIVVVVSYISHRIQQ